MLLLGCSSSTVTNGATDAAAVGDGAQNGAADAAAAGDGAQNDAAVPAEPVDASASGDADAAVDAGARAAWGASCTVGDDTCAAGLFCLQGPSGGTVGFCTKTCPKTSSSACSGAAMGTAAFCLVTDVNPQGDKGCAFVCAVGPRSYACPGALKCQTAEDPPGSGQRLCLP